MSGSRKATPAVNPGSQAGIYAAGSGPFDAEEVAIPASTCSVEPHRQRRPDGAAAPPERSGRQPSVWRVLEGDCREVLATLSAESVQCCVTSPPYWGLRDYGHAGQLGLERTPEEYVARMVEVFREVRRVLRPDGTLWLNLGDSYEPGKQLAGVPWRVALALRADGWVLRADVIWAKPNPMPESVADRPTKAHEYVFLLAASERYFYDPGAIAERGAGRALFGNSRRKGPCEQRQDNDRRDMTLTDVRNARTVWTISTKPFSGAHFATMPWDLAERCILAGSRANDVVLDPFTGAGTTGMVARRHGRRFTGIELNPSFASMARDRITGDAPLLNLTSDTTEAA